MHNLSNHVETRRIKPDGSTYAVAAGTGDLESDIIDMAGYEGIRFILAVGTITSGAVTSCKVQQNTANSSSGMADLLGTSQTIADSDSDQLVVTEIYRPRERYVRMVVDRGTQNAVIDGLIVELYGQRLEGISSHATVVGTEIHASPAEGQA
ncbi:MAG: hypothetical protein IT345_09780 [Trueperaceae bacterium]|nr:hypothetical protein [Trueperaceae bacterium]